jgi:DNA-binding MarR family transcriptional regulator
MDARVFLVAGIILGAGLVGGLGAYLAGPRADEPQQRASLRWRHLLLGVIAAACVPLFLSLVQSAVVGEMFQASVGVDGRSATPAYESYLIFVGLCLIAAFSSRRFIDSISKQLLQRLDEVDETAKGAAAVAADAREVAHEAVEEVEAADERLGGPAAPETAVREEAVVAFDAPALETQEETVSLTPVERKVLLAMTKRTMRTLTGIAEDSGVPRNKISELIDDLADRNLAVPAASPRTGGPRWVITKKGVMALKATF